MTFSPTQLRNMRFDELVHYDSHLSALDERFNIIDEETKDEEKQNSYESRKTNK